MDARRQNVLSYRVRAGEEEEEGPAYRDSARDAVGEEAGEAAAAMLGRGGVGLGGPAREQARVGVGAEGQEEHHGGGRGGRGLPPLPRRGGLELQQLQRLGGEADLLPDGAQAEHRRRRPALAVSVEEQLPAAAAAAEVDAPRRGGRGAIERGDRGRRREAHPGREEVREPPPCRGGEEARAAGERGRQRGGGQVQRQDAARRRRRAADRGVAKHEEGRGRGARRFRATTAGSEAEQDQDDDEQERHAFRVVARTGSWRSR